MYSLIISENLTKSIPLPYGVHKATKADQRNLGRA